MWEHVLRGIPRLSNRSVLQARARGKGKSKRHTKKGSADTTSKMDTFDPSWLPANLVATANATEGASRKSKSKSKGKSKGA